MELTLKDNVLYVTDGGIGAQNSGNVRTTLKTDLTGYTYTMACRYVDTSGLTQDADVPKDGDDFLIPTVCYEAAQVIMLTVISTRNTESVVSEPLYLRISKATAGGNAVPINTATWQSRVDSYVRSLLDYIIGTEYDETTSTLTIHTAAAHDYDAAEDLEV